MHWGVVVGSWSVAMVWCTSFPFALLVVIESALYYRPALLKVQGLQTQELVCILPVQNMRVRPLDEGVQELPRLRMTVAACLDGDNDPAK
jgi:hypothetical protein